MKWCNTCQKWKDENKFHKDKYQKDGLSTKCRECKREYRKNNKEHLSQKEKEHRKNNKEKVSKKRRKYYENHKEQEKQNCRKYKHSPLEYNSASQMRKEIELYEEIRESINGNVEIKCANCPNWFEPTKLQIENRIRAINREKGIRSEQKLYCSDICKENCPTYNQTKYPKGQKNQKSEIDTERDRELQDELREMVLERDRYACVKCGSQENLICHYIEGIHWEPIESADIDICITLCGYHHNEAHDQPGCKLHELKCSK